MPYKGLTLWREMPDPEEAAGMLQSVEVPAPQSWRRIRNPLGQFVWQVKPPGKWVVLMRLDERLVTSQAEVPLDVDYEAIFAMLVSHRAALLCRADHVVGLIGLAARKPGGPFLPLMPGFKAETSRLILPKAAEVVAESLKADRSWPEGLQKPSVIGIQSAHSLMQPEHRMDWLRRCPEGLWLLTMDCGSFQIFEVLG